MPRFHLEDDSNSGFVFDGDLIAHADSHTPDKDRWTELNLYRTTVGSYVVEALGCTRLPGEITRRRLTVVVNAAQIITTLHPHRHLSYVARDLLARAGVVDSDVQRAYAEYAGSR